MPIDPVEADLHEHLTQQAKLEALAKELDDLEDELFTEAYFGRSDDWLDLSSEPFADGVNKIMAKESSPEDKWSDIQDLRCQLIGEWAKGKAAIVRAEREEADREAAGEAKWLDSQDEATRAGDR